MTNGVRKRGRPGICTAGSPVLPCQQQKLAGRFDRLVAKCGDKVGLIASGANIPDGTRVTFAIRQYTKGVQVATERATMKSLLVTDKHWVTKKTFKGWEPPHVDFQVSTGGASADSMNRLRIHQYPDFASYPWSRRYNVTNRGINYQWDSKFDVEFKDSVLTITVKIKLTNYKGKQRRRGKPPLWKDRAGNYVPVDAKTKQRLKRSAEKLLSGKWLLHRKNCERGTHCNCQVSRQCCKFKIKVRVMFVESGQHHEVNLFIGKNPYTVNSEDWGRVPWDNLDYGHEVGHLLGCYDEYDRKGARGAIAPPSDRPPWRRNRPGSLMHASGKRIPKVYYRIFKGEFRLKTSEPWELVRK